jgi:hypothetical protein
MRIKLESEIEVTPEELLRNMSVTDIGALLSAAAEKLDGDNISRGVSAGWFSDGLSEDGARFVAEAIAQRFVKK